MKKQFLILTSFIIMTVISMGQSKELKKYTDFTFLPGEEKLLHYDFSELEVADLKEIFFNNTDKTISELTEYPAERWLYLYTGSTNSFPIPGIMPRDYTTIEFDIVPLLKKESQKPLSEIQIYFHSTLPDESFGDYVPGNGGFSITLANNLISAATWEKGNYTSDIPGVFFMLDSIKNEKTHVSFIFQSGSVQMFINEVKALNLENIVPTDIPPLDKMSFFIGGVNLDFSLLISNVCMATFIPDFRKQLTNKGKFSTYDIRFAKQSAEIQLPVSYSIIKEIANVISEKPKTKFHILITEHTSSPNEKLLETRGAALKKLITELGVNAENIRISVKSDGTEAELSKKILVEFIPE